MSIAEIIEAFGGKKEMSNKTGIPYTTIRDWEEAGAIGGRRVSEQVDQVLKAARKSGIKLSAQDLFPTPDPEARAP